MARVFEPFKIKSMELKNRIVLPPMVDNYSTEDGFVTQRVLDNYAARARDGWGLIIVHGIYVSFDGRVLIRHMGIDHDDKIAGLSELADIIHENGARAAIQIAHMSTHYIETIDESLFPSVTPELGAFKPRALSTEEVEVILNAFGEAARRAKQAGSDAVNVHACHRDLITAFSSPFDTVITLTYFV